MMVEHDFTWAVLCPSVFDKEAEFRPRFQPLGNEGGDDRINVSWSWRREEDGALLGQIHISTADPDESDIDVIEAHWSFVTFSTREGWIEAYRIARQVAKGGKFAEVEPGVFYEQPGCWAVNPGLHHIREAA